MTTRAKGKKLNKAWLHEHLTDPYVKLAQREGYRARAAYKLKEIDEQLHLLAPGQFVVDLGAAPGAWSQYVRRKFGRGAGVADPTTPPGPLQGTIVALDLLAFEPIDGVDFVSGDFREQAVLEALEAKLAGRPVDIVLSDMAPNLSGVAASDAARMADLVELAIDFAMPPSAAGRLPRLQGLSRQRIQSAGRAVQGVVSGRQGDQAQGLPGEVGRDLPRRHRAQSRCIRRRYYGRSEAYAPA